VLNRRVFLGSTLQSAASLVALPRLFAREKEFDCDVAVIGGGTGGVAAALAALRNGMRVILTEETDWIGGQLTAQAVPPDEHPWIEQFGCTRSYREYRNAVRAYYRDHYPLTEAARARPDLNPGNGSVSRLTHEFRVSVATLEAMLAPYVGSGHLKILLEHEPVSATTNGDRVTSVSVRDRRLELQRTITARYFLDATELGDLLLMAKVEHVTGAESRKQTGEMHAASEPQPANSQSFTFCFAMDHIEGEDHTIDKPSEYDQWRSYVPKMTPPWTGPLLSWTACEPKTLAPRKAYFDPNPAEARRSGLNFWIYRRIADRANFTPGRYGSDITLVNWPQNDFWLGDLVTAAPEQRPELLRRAKELSFAFLYWMQTEAPRPDGRAGWKGLRLRKDLVGTEDGMAKTAYIRESRRIQAEFTVLEKHVGADMRMKLTGKPREEIGAETFSDSVGVGCYRIDLHPSAGGSNYIDVSSLPFQIPLGALIPKRVENLLPACKNIGTTHITNGCYRLHPVEWNIGEAAGALAAFAVKAKTSARAVRNDAKMLADFQANLRRQGFELEWPRIHPV
jgi:FAD dependent oxidoreductase